MPSPRIGCAESVQIKYLARAIKSFKEKYPNFIFHIFSGDTDPVAERLDRGLLDLAVIVEPPNLSKYNYLPVPESDKWGVIMHRDSPLAKKSELTFEDIYGLPLFTSEQSIKVDFPRWCGENAEKLNIAGTFNVNDDGQFNIADVLILQKWLLAVPDVKLANWKAGDLCKDDRIDVFDLCLMKRKLLNEQK